MDNKTLFASWVRQQQELGMPDPVLEQGAAFVARLQDTVSNGRQHTKIPVQHVVRTMTTPTRQVKPPALTAALPNSSPFSRLRKLSPVAITRPAVAAPVAADGGPGLPSGPLTFDEKRAVFKELYTAACGKCHLAQGRKTFVFGAGNVDAPLMIIGEAPGQEEDAQGVPFVGPAGKLLSEMLTAVAIDRKKDVFITNILKCRPPGNRNPESAEILACLPLLEKQIAVVRPRLLLLLGRIAAHSLLDGADSISKMRGRVYSYKGVPAVVTYHPAAILRSMEYRGPTDEDFRKIAAMLKEGHTDGDS